MLNTLKDYICDSLPWEVWFSTNDRLRSKVSEQGGLLPYYGNTLVFLLDAQTRSRLRLLQQELYRYGSEMLAEPLQEDTFHMTLHDLINGPEDTPQLQAQMDMARQQALRLLQPMCPRKPLKMKATWTFNMVSTSIVLGLEPADPESYGILDELYTALERVVPLGYALTPHITLAYFRPGNYAPEAVDQLRRALHPVDLEILLKPENLVLQTFRDMNTYVTAAKISPEP